MSSTKNVKMVLLLVGVSTIAMMVLGSLFSNVQIGSNLTAEQVKTPLRMIVSAEGMNEFTIAEDDTLARENQLTKQSGNTIGLYFPKLYILNGSERGAVRLGYLPQGTLSLEKRMDIIIRYPKAYLQYIGTSVRMVNGVLLLKSSLDPTTDSIMLSIENLTSDPQLLATDEILSLPFVVGDSAPGMLLPFTIQSFTHTLFSEKVLALPFEATPVPVIALANREGTTSRRIVATMEQERLQRSAPTIPTSQQTTQLQVVNANSNAISEPLLPAADISSNTNTVSSPVLSSTSVATTIKELSVLPGASRFSPEQLTYGKDETLFFYSVLDAKSEDIQEVYLDGTTLGMASPIPLKITPQGDRIAIETSFHVPSSREKSPEFPLKLIVRTKQGLFARSLSVGQLIPSESSNTNMNSTISSNTNVNINNTNTKIFSNEPSQAKDSNQVEVDLNGDGQVDIVDMNLFLTAYKAATHQ